MAVPNDKMMQRFEGPLTACLELCLRQERVMKTSGDADG